MSLILRFLLQMWTLTFKTSLASATRCQSLSVRTKADHGIFFSIQPLRRMVVMGPYSESADWRKRLIGYGCHVSINIHDV
jgi:hypothetical protein